ncbi:hypothetical protein PV325_012124, partial [Microctonus aethiopoides]
IKDGPVYGALHCLFSSYYNMSFNVEAVFAGIDDSWIPSWVVEQQQRQQQSDNMEQPVLPVDNNGGDGEVANFVREWTEDSRINIISDVLVHNVGVEAEAAVSTSVEPQRRGSKLRRLLAPSDADVVEVDAIDRMML